jgi:flagellar basal-body rod protein FlgC
MPDTFNAALSALGAFFRKVDVTANNIANLNTNNFKKNRADIEEAYPSGVRVSISQINTPGDSLPSSEMNQNQETSNVNVAEELVTLITTEHAVSANIKTVTAEDEMQKTLIDIVA